MMKIKLVRSRIRKSPKQRQVLDALGLRRLIMVKVVQDNAAIRGMVAKISHMVQVVE